MVIILHRLFFVFIFCLAGCRFTYLVRVDGDQMHRDLDTPCGNGIIEMRGKGKHSFSLHQSFDAAENLELHFENLKVLFNNEELMYETMNESTGRALNRSLVRIKGDLDISINFSTAEPVFDGDTIVVTMEDYIRCGKQTVAVKPLVYQFNRANAAFNEMSE
jgi:hypothetical protein